MFPTIQLRILLILSKKTKIITQNWVFFEKYFSQFEDLFRSINKFKKRQIREKMKRKWCITNVQSILRFWRYKTLLSLRSKVSEIPLGCDWQFSYNSEANSRSRTEGPRAVTIWEPTRESKIQKTEIDAYTKIPVNSTDHIGRILVILCLRNAVIKLDKSKSKSRLLWIFSKVWQKILNQVSTRNNPTNAQT